MAGGRTCVILLLLFYHWGESAAVTCCFTCLKSGKGTVNQVGDVASWLHMLGCIGIFIMALNNGAFLLVGACLGN